MQAVKNQEKSEVDFNSQNTLSGIENLYRYAKHYVGIRALTIFFSNKDHQQNFSS